MAFHGILNCYRKPDHWFGGVTCTNGAGSARNGRYASYTDEQMQSVRVEEQDAAAVVGGYGIMIQLGYSSAEVKSPSETCLQQDLFDILRLTQPEIVYTHNPADKHDTHIGVVVAALQAENRFEVVALSREDCRRRFRVEALASSAALPR